MFAEASQSLYFVFGAHKHRNIIVTAAIRNHSHGNIAQSGKDTTLKTGIMPLEVSDNAYDNHIAVYAHRAESLEFVYNGRQPRIIVDAKRNSHLRCSHHIDACAIFLEYLENLVKEAICQQHAAAF